MEKYYLFKNCQSGIYANIMHLDFLACTLCGVQQVRGEYCTPYPNTASWITMIDRILLDGRFFTEEETDIPVERLIPIVERAAGMLGILKTRPYVEIYGMLARLNLHIEITYERTLTPSMRFYTLNDLLAMPWSNPDYWPLLSPHRTPDTVCSYEALEECEGIEKYFRVSHLSDCCDLFRWKGLGAKEVFMVNKDTRRVYHLVDEKGCIRAFTTEDIDPAVLEGSSTSCAKYLETRYAQMYVEPFRQGRARVTWMLRPDGSYYVDEEGYGREDCDEVYLEAYIDEHCQVLEKFHVV